MCEKWAISESWKCKYKMWLKEMRKRNTCCTVIWRKCSLTKKEDEKYSKFLTSGKHSKRHFRSISSYSVTRMCEVRVVISILQWDTGMLNSLLKVL
jgi:hypothetical protein